MARISKTIINPEYLASEDFKMRQEGFMDALVIGGDCPEDYFPDRYGKKIPEEGAWIQLLTSVDVGKDTDHGKAVHIHVPHLSIWYAMPALSSCKRSLEKGIKIAPSQAAIFTKDGEVRIWPREYNIVHHLEKYLEFTEEDGFYINFLDPSNEGFDANKLHYIRARGIGLAEARRMLLPELKGNPHYCYFTFHEEYSKWFPEGTGMPYLRGRVR